MHWDHHGTVIGHDRIHALVLMRCVIALARVNVVKTRTQRSEQAFDIVDVPSLDWPFRDGRESIPHLGTTLMPVPVTDGVRTAQLGHPSGPRFGTPFWTPHWDPPGGPPPGPPAPGGGAPGRGGARPAPRPPGGPRGAPGGPRFGPPKWARLGAGLYYCIWENPPFGGPRWGPPRGGRGPAPGGAKKCTFFWVFNNSPSRDDLGHFRVSGFSALGRFRGPSPGGIRGGYPVWGWPWVVSGGSVLTQSARMDGVRRRDGTPTPNGAGGTCPRRSPSSLKARTGRSAQR